MARVGFLGLGIMGHKMASRLLENGVEVMVWNRSRGKASELVASGAKEAETAAEVVASCKTTIAMLADPAASKSVVFGNDGVLAGMRDGHAYIDSSTVDEHSGQRIGEALSSKGGRFLSAPVSGGWRDAAKGALLFIAGGDRKLYDEVTVEGGLLTHLGHRHWFVGDSPAHAARAKLMLQIMMGNIVGSLAETIAVTQAAGLDPSQVLDMLNSSAMGNALCAAKGKLMVEGKYDPNFQVYLQQKDLRLALHLADELGVSAPISAAANGQYIRARQLGLGNMDFAAVRKAYDADTGTAAGE